MKTKLAITALALTLSTSAVAANTQGDVVTCEAVREGSQSIMEIRQRGYSLDTALSTDSHFFDDITAKAYTYPVFKDTPMQAEALVSFGGQMYLTCMSGGMEYDGNVLKLL